MPSSSSSDLCPIRLSSHWNPCTVVSSLAVIWCIRCAARLRLSHGRPMSHIPSQTLPCLSRTEKNHECSLFRVRLAQCIHCRCANAQNLFVVHSEVVNICQGNAASAWRSGGAALGSVTSSTPFARCAVPFVGINWSRQGGASSEGIASNAAQRGTPFSWRRWQP